MYRTGHYGVALLAYAPVGLALALLGRAPLALAGGAAVLFLTPLPDYDQRVPLVTHRGVTHTLLFAAVVGGALAGLALAVPSLPDRAGLAAFAFFVGAFAVVVHLLGDVITPAGITPLWPLSSREYAVPLARADNTLANYLLLALGVFVTGGALLLARSLGTL
ncbi:MAG: metal-dependent hydrolase [Halobacteriaceae archaeon]